MATRLSNIQILVNRQVQIYRQCRKFLRVLGAGSQLSDEIEASIILRYQILARLKVAKQDSIRLCQVCECQESSSIEWLNLVNILSSVCKGQACSNCFQKSKGDVCDMCIVKTEFINDPHIEMIKSRINTFRELQVNLEEKHQLNKEMKRKIRVTKTQTQQIHERGNKEVEEISEQIDENRRQCSKITSTIQAIQLQDRERFQETYKTIKQLQFDADMVRINIETKSIQIKFKQQELENLTIYKNRLVSEVILRNIPVTDILAGLDEQVKLWKPSIVSKNSFISQPQVPLPKDRFQRAPQIIKEDDSLIFVDESTINDEKYCQIM